jgi:2-polyprenyl-3-methyl-5-hydroxy-6-metoxy-1,4-benzoquinol methylase
MFEHRSDEDELMDDLSLSGDELNKNLDELAFCNRVFGSNRALIASLNEILNKYPDYFNNNKVVIADIGCGGGDQLMVMNEWAIAHHLNVQLVGIEANPFMIHYAQLHKHTVNNIEYLSLNIFSSEFANMNFDIITVNSLSHHFKNEELTHLIGKLKIQSRLAVVINDLHRHWMSYYSIKIFASIFKFSALSKIDGPLSVLRAFRKQELINLFKQAHVHSYQISWAWPFRWVAIIWCHIK